MISFAIYSFKIYELFQKSKATVFYSLFNSLQKQFSRIIIFVNDIYFK